MPTDHLLKCDGHHGTQTALGTCPRDLKTGGQGALGHGCSRQHRAPWPSRHSPAAQALTTRLTRCGLPTQGILFGHSKEGHDSRCNAMNRTTVGLRGRRQTREPTCCVCPLPRNVPNRRIHRHGKRLCGSQGLGEGSGDRVLEERWNVLELGRVMPA